MPADVGHDCCTVTCNIQLWTGGQTAETGGEMFIDFAAAERLTDVCSPVISARVWRLQMSLIQPAGVNDVHYCGLMGNESSLFEA